jgi:hypothetical protein
VSWVFVIVVGTKRVIMTLLWMVVEGRGENGGKD